MSGRNLDDDFLIGASNKARIGSGFSQHWRYPSSVGMDTQLDNINFNSHEASEYAKLRLDKISEITHEPFMLLEFLTIDKSKQAVAGEHTDASRDAAEEVLGNVGSAVGSTHKIYNTLKADEDIS